MCLGFFKWAVSAALTCAFGLASLGVQGALASPYQQKSSKTYHYGSVEVFSLPESPSLARDPVSDIAPVKGDEMRRNVIDPVIEPVTEPFALTEPPRMTPAYVPPRPSVEPSVRHVAQAPAPSLPRARQQAFPVEISSRGATPLRGDLITAPSGVRAPHMQSSRSAVSDVEPEDAVDVQAHEMNYDEDAQRVSAEGNVFITQSGRTLRADQVFYDVDDDRVVASGNIVLTDVNGDIHQAERLELRDRMKTGVIESLRSQLEDESRFTAEKGERFDARRTVMHDASYTPCDVCETDPEAEPVWQIKAKEVEHDEDAQKISYKHAKLEVYGTPVLYAPYFSHPDSTVERKSGFLSPEAGYKSDFGMFVNTRYYWDVAPDKDLTVGVIGYTKEEPLVHAAWRQRWDDASLIFKGGITNSERVDSVSGVRSIQEEETRGHVLAEALWDINSKWRAGADIQWASDDQYMRQYDFIDEDVLTSDLYAERFSGRDYFSGRLITFQDVRVRDEREDQPEVLPEIVASFQGNPGGVPVFGGSWFFDSSYLGLRRDGSEQDMDRFSLGGGWKRHFVSQTGLLLDTELSARQDIYHVRDRDVATDNSGIRREASEVRFFPQAHIKSSYPMVRHLDNMQVTLAPEVAVTLAPNIDVTDKVPNEDSRDVQIDAANLFEANRFPGLDRVEDQSHLTYGMRAGLYNYNGASLRGFLGQSYRLDEDDNPFPQGSGLNNRSSDIVGEIASSYSDQYNLNYRFQLDSRHLTSQRHEVDAYADFGRYSLGSRYLFAKALEGTDIVESREQVEGDVGYYWTDNWHSRIGFKQDLGEAPGLRRAYVGIDHFGQCVFWSLTGERNLTDDLSGESSTEILFRIGLKNLGEFERPKWHSR